MLRVLLVLFLVALFAPGYFFADDRYWLELFTRYMALALFALSVDLIWGYTGLMSLGQGLFFGMGVYAVGYSLMFQKACLDADMPLVQQANMPRYPLLSSLPDWTGYLVHIWFAISLAVAIPVVFGAVFGYFTFLRRIKGVYFSLITQALLLAFFTLTDNNLPITGGRVGMPYLPRLKLFGHEFQMVGQYFLTVGILCVCFLVSLAMMRSKFGKVLTAIRDSEYRVLALGYNTAMYKTFIFAYAAGMAGIAGALYVASLRTAGPDVMHAELLDRGRHPRRRRRARDAGRGDPRGRPRQPRQDDDQRQVRARPGPSSSARSSSLVVLLLPDGILGGLDSLSQRLRRPGVTPTELAILLERGPSWVSRTTAPLPDQILQIENVTVAFSGFTAINDLTFAHPPRRVARRHRPQRGRQDDPPRRDHRQDPAAQRQRLDDESVRLPQRPDAPARRRPSPASASAASSRRRTCSRA